MREVLPRYIASLPESKRLDEICRLMWETLKSGCAGLSSSTDNIPQDSSIYFASDEGIMLGSLTDVSYISVFPDPEKGYEAYFADDGKYRRLLFGDYPDYGGGIFYDGTELREINRDRLNRVAACIHQYVFLFDDTVRNNICLFDGFSDGQFDRAVRTSGVRKFIETLPEGAEYVVGEHGERLSGGQKQRIAIARALIRNTNFLILDEGRLR